MSSSWPRYTSKEILRIEEIIKSGNVNYWTGNEGKSFEKEFSKFCKTKYSVAVSNGTVALEIALKAIGIKKNDEVIVPSCTYIATATAVLNVGANPIFADINLSSLNIEHNEIKKLISKKTRAIIVVHLGGYPCDMDRIIKIAKAKNLKVIEDCSQAHGAKYKKKPVGSIGDISTWSFCQDKIISTLGEGGMIATNKKKYFDFIWSYKDHGKSKTDIKKSKDKIGFKWIHSNRGSNYRLTEIQSAVGRIQLRNIEKNNIIRRSNAEAILKICSKYSQHIRAPLYPYEIKHAWYRCYVFVEQNGLINKFKRDKLLAILNKNGVRCFTGSCAEIYREKVFSKYKFKPPKRLKNSKKIQNSSIAFLIDQTISKKEMKIITKKIDKIFKQYFKIDS